jgi:hypothetical protein
VPHELLYGRTKTVVRQHVGKDAWKPVSRRNESLVWPRTMWKQYSGTSSPELVRIGCSCDQATCA